MRTLNGIDVLQLAHSEVRAYRSYDRELATIILDAMASHGHGHAWLVAVARKRAARHRRDNYIDPLALPVDIRRDNRKARIIRRRMLARRKAVQA